MKRLSFSIILILLIIAPSDMPQAKVTGECSNCHTMHNSQAGGPMAQTLTDDPSWQFTDDETPNPSLLIYSCVGCHTNVTNGATIDANNKPFVFNPINNPGSPLAGGNFYYLIGDHASGHNVVGIANSDPNFTGYIPGSTTTYSGNQVTCAGAKGCHGDRDASDQLDAMKGAHHTNDESGITGASVGLSYRFLGKTGEITGVLGIEDDDWESETTVNHNEYKGATNFTTSSSISYLCGNCHGNFHSEAGVNTESPWLRHPTDYLLPQAGEYSNYDPTTTYENKAPVAWTDPSSQSRSTAVVMCLSCHRAHASPYYKLMRWNNKANMSGCVVCHTSKN